MSKKDKHARTQAKYMARKREAGLDWLAVWVPEPACEAFKTIAKAARKSRNAPAATSLAEAAAIAERQATEIPDWAKSSDMLMMVWQAAQASTHVLEQLQGERDAAKARKAEAKAAKAAEADKHGDAQNVPDASPITEEPATEQPTAAEPRIKRSRRSKNAAEPSVPSSESLAMEPGLSAVEAVEAALVHPAQPVDAAQSPAA